MITAETVARILRFDGGDLPVLSAYVAVEVDPGNRAPRTHAASLMHTIRPQPASGGGGGAARGRGGGGGAGAAGGGGGGRAAAPGPGRGGGGGGTGG